jgi:hypothetical protein
MESTYSGAQIAIIAAALRTTGGCQLHCPGTTEQLRLMLESRHAAGMEVSAPASLSEFRMWRSRTDVTVFAAYSCCLSRLLRVRISNNNADRMHASINQSQQLNL